MTQKTMKKVLNGVDVEELQNTVNAVKEDSGLAKFKFRISNKWFKGGHNQSTVGNFFGVNQENEHLHTFKLDQDEPPVFLGEDLGANPMEYVLHALAGCLSTTLVYHAAIRGIQIDELESEVEGDMDLRGFLGLSDDVRMGYENIRVNFKVKTDSNNLAKLRELSKFSAVYDILSNGTNVDVNIDQK